MGNAGLSDLTVWYANHEEGLAQGFIVSQPPPKGQGREIILELALDTDLAAALAADGAALELTDPSGRLVLRYGGLAATDAAGRVLPVRLGLGQGAGDRGQESPQHGSRSPPDDRGLSICGAASGYSGRTGEFTFGLTPGSG